jgi:hypothetical protein
MRRFLMAAVPALLTGVFASVAPALAEDEVRRVEGLDFDRIVVAGDVKVEVRQGATCELQLRGDPDDLDQDPFYVSRGRLVLGKRRDNRDAWDDDLRFRVVLPTLRELRVDGSGRAYVRAFRVPADVEEPTEFSVNGSGDMRVYAFEGPILRLRVKGSGDLKVAELQVSQLKALVSGSGGLFIRRIDSDRGEFVATGSGDLRVTEGGYVRDLEVSVVGSGDAELDGVAAELVEANVVGSGSVSLGEVGKVLSASILGSGDIRYEGDPVIDETVLGSGEIRRRD